MLNLKHLRKILKSGRAVNAIFYGPPGTGKTSLAEILSYELSAYFEKMNATTATVSDIKEIVIEDKWLKHISSQIKEEINRVTTNLANRIKTLEERYKEPLKSLENDVNILSKKVEKHLKAMGLSW